MAEVRPDAEAPKAEFEGAVYRTAFAWKAIKETPEAAFRALLVAHNWSDVQRLSEDEYVSGLAAAVKEQVETP
jgi:hypothetical protein